MKAFKKLLALVLAVCMLIGMPLSIDVAAIGGAANDWRQALVIPAEWNTGHDSGRAFRLYFTGDVNIDTSTVGAAVTIVDAAGWAQSRSIPGITGNTVTHWHATVERDTTNFGSVNNYVVTIKDEGNINNGGNANINFDNLLQSIAGTSLRLVVRLYDNAGVSASVTDGYVDGVTFGTTKMKATSQAGPDENGWGYGCRKSTGQREGGYKGGLAGDFRDIEIKTVDQAATPRIQYAHYDASTYKLTVKFSLPINFLDGFCSPIFPRVVNSAGEYMYTSAASGSGDNNYADDTFVSEGQEIPSGYSLVGAQRQGDTGGRIRIDLATEGTNGSDTFSWSLSAEQRQRYNDCVSAVTELNKGAGPNEYSVVLAVEDGSTSFIHNEAGGAHNNGFVDHIWNPNTMMPMVATDRGVGDNADRAWVKLQKTENIVATVNGVPYETFDAALAAMGDTDTLTLLKNATFNGEDFLNIEPGQTLDLNGFTLDMNGKSLVSTGNVTDSSEGGALIVTEQPDDEHFIQFGTSEDHQLPLYDTSKGGYRLYTASVTSRDIRDVAGTNGDVVRFGMHLEMSDYELLKQDGSGVSVDFAVTSNRLEGEKSWSADPEDLVDYANNNDKDSAVLVLSIIGMNNLKVGDTLTVTGKVVSANVVKDVIIGTITVTE